MQDYLLIKIFEFLDIKPLNKILYIFISSCIPFPIVVV